MVKLVKIVGLLLAVVSLPLALMMAGFAPALVGAPKLTALQKVWGTSLVVAMTALPIWILYFGWRTLKTWSSPSYGPALLAALPALAVIAFFLVANFGRFAP
jgi:hypothetical protein